MLSKFSPRDLLHLSLLLVLKPVGLMMYVLLLKSVLGLHTKNPFIAENCWPIPHLPNKVLAHDKLTTLTKLLAHMLGACIRNHTNLSLVSQTSEVSYINPLSPFCSLKGYVVHQIS